MAKTKPIGVRFDEEMLEDLKLSPQKALNFLTDYFYAPKKIGDTTVTDLTKPTNVIKSFEQPKTNYSINTNQKSYSEYNFINEQWLSLEKYTKFPNSQKPKTWRSQMEWTKQKKESDHKIIIAWAEFKKDINDNII